MDSARQLDFKQVGDSLMLIGDGIYERSGKGVMTNVELNELGNGFILINGSDANDVNSGKIIIVMDPSGKELVHEPWESNRGNYTPFGEGEYAYISNGKGKFICVDKTGNVSSVDNIDDIFNYGDRYIPDGENLVAIKDPATGRVTFKVLGAGLKEVRTIPGDFARYEISGDAYASTPIGIDDAGKKHYFTPGGGTVPADADRFVPLKGNRYCLIEKGTKWAYTDNTGKVITPWFPIPKDAYTTDNLGYIPRSPSTAVEKNWGCVSVCQNGKWGVYDYEKRKMVIPCLYDLICTYYKGDIVTAKKNGKYGLLNYKTGAVIIPFRYDSLNRFRNDENFVGTIKLSVYKSKADEITTKGHIVKTRTYYN